MENLQTLKDLVSQIEVEQAKVDKGNKSAATRVRKYLQEIKSLVPKYRADVLAKVKAD